MARRKLDGQLPKDRSKKVKESTVEHNDLCTTCNNPPVCDSTKAKRRPVHNCEQFDNHVPPKPVFRISKEKPDEEPDYSGYTGICKNCEIRETCMSSGTEGGIWHCEEYC